MWVDGAESYGLACSRNVSGFLQFSETCYIDECLSFITSISENYSKSFVECSPLLVLWLVLAQPENTSIYQMFGKKYVFLSGEILNICLKYALRLQLEPIAIQFVNLESFTLKWLNGIVFVLPIRMVKCR